MANGRVITGYSYPWVALYANSGSTVSYSGGIPLARGVSVNMSVDNADNNDFYADNVLAESGGGAFAGGSVTLEVDGLKPTAAKLIAGVSDTASYGTTGSEVVFDAYGEGAVAPYVGIGFVIRYQEAGEVSYDAVVLTKCQFSPEGLEASTQEESIEYQTTSLEATMMRDDTAKHNWKLVKSGCETEAEAVAAYKAVLLAAS